MSKSKQQKGVQNLNPQSKKGRSPKPKEEPSPETQEVVQEVQEQHPEPKLEEALNEEVKEVVPEEATPDESLNLLSEKIQASENVTLTSEPVSEMVSVEVKEEEVADPEPVEPAPEKYVPTEYPRIAQTQEEKDKALSGGFRNTKRKPEEFPPVVNPNEPPSRVEEQARASRVRESLDEPFDPSRIELLGAGKKGDQGISTAGSYVFTILEDGESDPKHKGRYEVFFSKKGKDSSRSLWSPNSPVVFTHRASQESESEGTQIPEQETQKVEEDSSAEWREVERSTVDPKPVGRVVAGVPHCIELHHGPEKCVLTINGKEVFKGTREQCTLFSDATSQAISILGIHKQKPPREGKKGPRVTHDGKSNKQIIYEAWEASSDKADKTDEAVERYLSLVNHSVEKITVKGWIGGWNRGYNLPAVAKS